MRGRDRLLGQHRRVMARSIVMTPSATALRNDLDQSLPKPDVQTDGQRSPNCHREARLLPLAPRHPRQCIQHLQHRNIRAVIFPCPVGRITPKVARALSVACTHCTNPLKILESPGYGRGDLILVEIKGSYSTGQESAASGPCSASLRSSDTGRPKS